MMETNAGVYKLRASPLKAEIRAGGFEPPTPPAVKQRRDESRLEPVPKLR